MSLRIYDPEIQQGSNACKVNKGNCSHLCLPISPTERVCRCGTGYVVDPSDPTKCIGKSFILDVYHIPMRVVSVDNNLLHVLNPNRFRIIPFILYQLGNKRTLSERGRQYYSGTRSYIPSVNGCKCRLPCR